MNAPAAPISRHWMHPAADGARLFVQCSEPGVGQARGSVLLTHGMGEHAGRYHHVIGRLNAMGLRVVSWDLRGHGRSDGRRGDIRSYDVLVEDMREVWELTAAGPGPMFLYAHSLGGQIALNFAVRHKPETAGMVVTSPWLRLAFAPPWWKLALAWMTVRVWPSFSQDTEVMPNRLSRDLAFLAAMPDRELVHHRMSARMYGALTEGGRRASEDGAGLTCPMLLIHGSRDPITSAAATEEFYGRLGSKDKELVIVPDALHETHNDVCREEVLGRIVGWIEARLV